MNRLQRYLRALSDQRLDDTAVEMTACERARLALQTTLRAIADGRVTDQESEDIIQTLQGVLEASELSLALNVQQQPQLDNLVSYLGHIPADALARMPVASSALGGRDETGADAA